MKRKRCMSLFAIEANMKKSVTGFKFQTVMSIVAILLAFIIPLLEAQSPQWSWVESVGSNGTDYCYDIVIDSLGNSYLTGMLSSLVSFGDIQLQRGTFLSKISDSGEWIMARELVNGDDQSYFASLKFTFDNRGNIYFAGHFRGTAHFDEIILTETSFVAKMDSRGVWQWAKAVETTGRNTISSIAVDGNNSAYLAGYFESTARFGETELVSEGYADIFLAKINSRGEWEWAVRAGGTGTVRAYDIDVDTDGNCSVTGLFYGPASFGDSVIYSGTESNTYVAKINSHGQWQWATAANGTMSNWANGITIDSEGNHYVAGTFRGTVNFGATELVYSGNQNVFVAKMDARGEWVWAISNTGQEGEWANSIAVDGSGNSYITGAFRAVAVFGDTELVSDGHNNVFVAKIDNRGEWKWAMKGGITNTGSGSKILVDESGNSFLMGSFVGTARFGEIEVHNDSGSDFFVAKIRQRFSYPALAMNPYPADNSEGVSVELEELKWKYINNPNYEVPQGFRVYFSDTDEFDDEDFIWVAYDQEQEDYSTAAALPDELEYFTNYYWKVVPTTIDPDDRSGGRNSRHSQRYGQDSVLSLHRGDAENVPVWTFRTEQDTSVENVEPKLMTKLAGNYPNPFNPETMIEFSIKEDTEATLHIYNFRGQLVKTLHTGSINAGEHRLIWNGTDDNGRDVGSGVYFYRLKTDSYDQVNKMLLVK